MKRSEEAIQKYKSGYSCAQAVACAYADVMEMNEVAAYRLSEGFGGGMGHYGHTCGACSAMVMVASYLLCPDMQHIGVSKNVTYPVIKEMVKHFHDANGHLNCFDILRDGSKGMEAGKRISCIQCVRSACGQLDDLLETRNCKK